MFSLKNRFTDIQLSIIEPVAIALVVFLLFNALLPVNLWASHDSLVYLLRIDNSTTPWLFHPHHLLYEVAGAAFWRLWQLFGYTGDALLPLQELNIIFGCLSIATVYTLLRRILSNRWHSLLVCLALVFSFGFWFYSSTVEVYIIPLFFLLVSFSLTLRSLQNPSFKLFAFIGILNALAVLFHQMNVLFIMVVILSIVINHELSVWKTKLKAMAYYGTCLVLPVVVAYSLAIALKVQPDSINDVIYWLTDYFHSSAYGKLEIVTPIKSLIGFANVFIGGHFIFSLPYISGLVSSVFSERILVGHQFLAESIGTVESITLLVGCLPLAVVFITAVISYIRIGKSIFKKYHNLLVLSFFWLVPYTIFTLWWEPGNLEFWIACLFPVWIIISIPFFTSVASAVGYRRHFYKYLLPFSIACMLLVNLFGSMLPLHSSENDYYYQKTHWYACNTQQGDLIICSRSWLLGQYLTRNTEADIIGLAELLHSHKPDTEAVASIIDQHISAVLDGGGNVYITSDSIDPETITLKAWGLTKQNFTDLFEEYKSVWERIPIDNEDITYEVQNTGQSR